MLMSQKAFNFMPCQLLFIGQEGSSISRNNDKNTLTL